MDSSLAPSLRSGLQLRMTVYHCHSEGAERPKNPRNGHYFGKKMDEKKYFVYIITNKRNGTLYIGVTNNLIRRIYEHKNKIIDGFSKKYGLDKLVYFEEFPSIEEAIKREKYLKGKKRQFKIDLIEKSNKKWEDLYYRIIK